MQDPNQKVFGILSYIGPLFLVGLIAAPQDEKVKFHVNQGLVLFLLEVVISVVSGILSIIPFIWFIGTIISAVGGIFTLVLAILGIVNVCQNVEKPLPIIGQITFVK